MVSENYSDDEFIQDFDDFGQDNQQDFSNI